MKKFILIAAFALSISAGAFAAHNTMNGFALGIEFRGDYLYGPGGIGSPGYGPAFTFKFPDILPVFGLSFLLGNSLTVGATVDWWLFKTTLATGAVDLCLYIGPGIYGSIIFGQDYMNGNVGLRIPVGLQLFLVEPLELFFELAPAIGIGGMGQAIYFPAWGIQGNIGFRFWF